MERVARVDEGLRGFSPSLPNDWSGGVEDGERDGAGSNCTIKRVQVL